MASSTPSHSDRVHALNDLLQGEIAATETYNEALVRFKDGAVHAALRRLRDEHVDAAMQLKRHVVGKAGTPETSSGAWGAFAKAVEATAKALGRDPALRALQEGEEYGTKLYARGLDDKDLDPNARRLLADVLLPRQQQHVATIRTLRVE